MFNLQTNHACFFKKSTVFNGPFVMNVHMIALTDIPNTAEVITTTE